MAFCCCITDIKRVTVKDPVMGGMGRGGRGGGGVGTNPYGYGFYGAGYGYGDPYRNADVF
jgi:hypothetical protein